MAGINFCCKLSPCCSAIQLQHKSHQIKDETRTEGGRLFSENSQDIQITVAAAEPNLSATSAA